MINKENWDEYMPNFSIDEYSENPIKYADPTLLLNQQKLRYILNNRMFPSPVSGSLARFSGSSKSEHYAVNRKSTANDVFIEGNSLLNWSLILSSQLFKGVGIYLDTEYNYRPWVMFHLDIREKGFMDGALIWMRYRGDYYYPQLNAQDKLDFRNIMCNNILLKENFYKR